MEDSCPATPLVLTGRESKSPLQIAISSPESDRMKSPSRDSPDSRCVICLGRLHNKSFTDSCLHKFCFQCLLQWSKVKPECPLCKQPFKSIIHNVRSNFDYDQYDIDNEEPHCVLSELMHSYDFNLIPVERRFRYRSTMTREYFRELAESFLAQTRRIPEGSFQIPPLPLDAASVHESRYSSRLRNSSLQQRLRQRGTSDFRRNVYAQDLWVQDLVDISGRYRECTPQFYRENPAQIHRIIPWLNREVNVLLNNSESRAAYVLTRIVSSLTHHSIRSREFRELVLPYFGDRTDHFIHELYTFARSVYDIAGFDEHAVYGTNPNYATEVQEISSSNDDSDIEVLETVKNEDKKFKKQSKQSYKKILLKRAGEENLHLDEPVAGPSGILSGGNTEAIELCESDSDDIKVLDYVKPEPEVVTLTSGDESNVFSEGEYSVNRKEIEEICTRCSVKSDSDWSEERRKARRKTGKGKCKSDGVGLKGKQKRKYIKAKKRRSSSTSSSNSTSSDTSSTSSSSNSSYNKSRRHSSLSCISDSSSDYQPSNKSKKKKSKGSRKKSKKKSKSLHRVSGKKGRKFGSNSHNDSGKTSVKRKRVKSCVIVPSSRSRDAFSPVEYSSRSSDDRKLNNSSKSLLKSYWSFISDARENSRRGRSSSAERGSVASKRKHRDSVSKERVRKRVRNLSSSSGETTKSSDVSSRRYTNEDRSVSSGGLNTEKEKSSQESKSLENTDSVSKSTPSSSSTSLSPSTGSIDCLGIKINSASSVNSDLNSDQ